MNESELQHGKVIEKIEKLEKEINGEFGEDCKGYKILEAIKGPGFEAKIDALFKL
jgi:uncharacterized protein (UPF0335 family)